MSRLLGPEKRREIFTPATISLHSEYRWMRRFKVYIKSAWHVWHDTGIISHKSELWNYGTEFWFQIIRFLLFFFSGWNGKISLLRQQRLDGDRQTSLKTATVNWIWKFWKVRRLHKAKRLKVRFWNVYSVVSCCFFTNPVVLSLLCLLDAFYIYNFFFSSNSKPTK